MTAITAGNREPHTHPARYHRGGPPEWRAAGPAPAARRTPVVRLTRRGQIVAAVFAVAGALGLCAVIGLTAAGQAQAAGRGAPPGAARAHYARVVVRPGQTLWSIALSAQPAADPRIVVQQIIDLNALPGTAVQAGESLLVPHR